MKTAILFVLLTVFTLSCVGFSAMALAAGISALGLMAAAASICSAGMVALGVMCVFE